MLNFQILQSIGDPTKKNGAFAQRAGEALPSLMDVAAFYQINTPLRMAHFLAQVFHESGGLRYREEIASGDAYDTRTDLGNTPERDGDGRLFKGRGYIQLTGRANYQRYALYVEKSRNKPGFLKQVMADPKIIAQEPWCSDSAGWYWLNRVDRQGNNLNVFADQDRFIRITQMVNGGFNGIHDRLMYLGRAYRALNVSNPAQRIQNHRAKMLELGIK